MPVEIPAGRPVAERRQITTPTLGVRELGPAAAGGRRRRRRKKSGGIFGGVGGFVKNLAGDVEDAAVGIGPGLVQAGKAVGADAASIARDVAKHPEHALAAISPVTAVQGLIITKGGKSETYKKVVKPVAKSYAETYGPLFRGDVRQFGRNLYEHPLGPILDALTVATAGAGGVAKAGKVLSKVGAVSKDSRLARLGEPGEIVLRSPAARQSERLAREAQPRPGGMPELPEVGADVTKRTSPNPLIRARQQGTDKLLKRLPAEAPIVGEDARFWRAARRDPVAAAAVLRQQSGPYLAAYGRLSKEERQAFGVLSRVPLEEHLDAWKQMLAHDAEMGGEDAARLLETLNDPKVLEHYRNPTDKMLRAHEEAAKLGEKAAANLQRLGVLTRAEAESARYRHTRIAAGADVYTPGHAKSARRQISTQIRGLQRDQQTVDRLLGRLLERGTPESRAVSRYAGRTATMGSRAAKSRQAAAEFLAEWEKRRQKLPWGGLAQQENITARAEQLTRHDLGAAVQARRITEEEMLRQARADIASRLTAGRAELDRLHALEQELTTRREEIHPGIVGGPDVDELRAQLEAAGRPEPIYMPDVEANPEAKPRKGGAAFTYSNPARQSEGVLFTTGRLAIDPDVLGPNFLRVVQFSLYRDLHDLLLDSARSVRGPYKPRPDEVFVKWPTGLEKLPDLDTLVENPRLLEKLEEGISQSGLTTSDAAEAYKSGRGPSAQRFVVPVRLARQVEAEFARSSNVVSKFFQRSTTVWRALVLNLRVAWLVNNVVGNHLLYALKYSGPRGLKAYLNAVRTAKGPSTVRDLLRIKHPDALTAEDVAELLPEQATGTFIGTQAPRSARAGRVTRAYRGLSEANRANEGMLRRAAAETELRRSPEVRARRKAMPKETRSFREAARQELAHNPQLAREVSQKVNDALGDYLSLSPFERRYLRQLMPFWAWYRAITTITGKLVLNTPGRTDALQKIADVGNDWTDQELGELPSFLHGAVPLGENRLLKTQPLNPFATIPQLGRAAAVPFVPGAATNQLAGITNPFIQAGGGMLFGRERTKHGLAVDLLMGIGTDLPEVTVGRSLLFGPKPSKLYEPSALDDVFAFLGGGVKTLNRRRARELHREGR